MKWKTIFGTWKKVFGNWRYLTATIIIAMLFYAINVLISSWNSLVSFYSSFGFFGTIKFFFILALGFKETIKFHSYISLIIISILFGMLFSLIGYKVKLGNWGSDKKAGLLGTIGVFLAAFAPGCAACGIGLASALGIGAGFLTFFPYDGLELSIAAILIMGFTIMKVTKDMYVCKTSKFRLTKKFKSKAYK